MEARQFFQDVAFSDYGSDFDTDEEEIINELLKNASNAPPLPVALSINQDCELYDGSHAWQKHGQIRLSSVSTGKWSHKQLVAFPGKQDGFANAEENAQNTETQASRAATAFEEPMSKFRALEQASTNEPDVRSPLQRFRSKPQKALSVTDIVSPSWCELQYWYSLTKHGRKRSTPAMTQGSAVHQVLESQVHRTVEVDIRRKEDAWGSRLWNIVQGLRGLRETGLTRELEVWGILDGEVINGVIDEISFRCPDQEMEERAAALSALKDDQPAADQMSLDSSFKQRDQGAGEASSFASAQPRRDHKVYLTDVKTRSVKSLPTGASFRPTAMQLMLYRILLSDLATDCVNADIVFSRYSLDPDQDFSDAFLASLQSVSNLSYEISFQPLRSEQTISTQKSSLATINHKTLRRLWALMIREFQETLPHGVESIGQVLRAEYRGQVDGVVLGEKNFPFDKNAITQYLQDEMRWWKGERAVQGVCIEEAYKCRTCEFADHCEWRKKKVDEATMAHRIRSRSAI